MDGLIEKVLDLIKSLVTPEQGTKFLVSFLAIGGAGALTYYDKMPGWACAVVMAAVAVGYFVSRLHEKGQLKSSNNSKSEGTDETPASGTPTVSNN